MKFLFLLGLSVAKEEIKLVELLSPQWPSEFTKPQYDLPEPCPVYQIAHVRSSVRLTQFQEQSTFPVLTVCQMGPM